MAKDSKEFFFVEDDVSSKGSSPSAPLLTCREEVEEVKERLVEEPEQKARSCRMDEDQER
jgi:hypothetical protein